MNQFQQSVTTHNKLQGIEVYIRIKPPNHQNFLQSSKKCVFLSTSEQNTIVVQTQNKKEYFSFDHIASENSTQSQIYQKIGRPIIQECFKGYNCCIFAYGQTGAGKTYSILGNSSELNENHYVQSRGILPRLLQELFYNSRKRLYKTCQIKCSYLEIYNEQIIDLLNKDIKVYQIREDFKKGVFVDGLSEQNICNYTESLEFIMKGVKNRKIATTYMNSESSRSHAIFTISINFSLEQQGIQITRSSKIHIVDLAGSQRIKLAKIEGDRLKQGCNINKSLHVLGNVINSLVQSLKKKKYIPFRDSKLTYFLKDSLGGNSKTRLLANINSSKSYLGDTISTLMFSKRAKIIKCRVQAQQNITDNYESLRNQIKKLREELAETKFLKKEELKLQILSDFQFNESERKFDTTRRQKIADSENILIDQNSEGFLKIFQENEMHFRMIIQLNQQRLTTLSMEKQKNEISKLKSLFKKKNQLQKQNSHCKGLIMNFKPFTKIFLENNNLKKKLNEQELLIKILNSQKVQLQKQIEKIKNRNKYIQNKNLQLKKQNEQLYAMTQMNEISCDSISINFNYSEAKEMINHQNNLLQEYEIMIEQSKIKFEKYIKQLICSYQQLQKQYQKQKQQKQQIKKMKRKSITPDIQTLENQNQYLKLNILEIETQYKQLEENLFKNQIELKTANQQIILLKQQIKRLQQRQQIGIKQCQLNEILERLKQIKIQAQNEKNLINQELQKQNEIFNEINIKLKKTMKQNCEILNHNQILTNNNKLLKKKLNQFIKFENQFELNKQSTQIVDQTIQKTINIDLLKQIDKINLEKQVLLNKIQAMEQNKFEDCSIIEKYYNKNLNLTKQLLKLKQENRNNIQQIRRIYVEIQAFKVNEKQLNKKINQLIRYQNIIQKIKSQFSKDINQIIQEYKRLILRNQQLNHENQKIRKETLSQQKFKYSSSKNLTKSMKILPIVREISQIQANPPRNILGPKNQRCQDIKQTSTNKIDIQIKRQSHHIKKNTQQIKPIQHKTKQFKELFIFQKDDKPVKITKKK